MEDRGFTLLARRCRMSVIRDSVRANLARAGGKIIHRLPAHETDRECVRRRILTVNAKHVGRPYRGISCFGPVKKILSPGLKTCPDNRGVLLEKQRGQYCSYPMTIRRYLASEYLAETIYIDTWGQPISLCA